ncbi:ribosome silencing factor [Solimonas marina]|uniref:Ribosomal silencing factor RsfS n=1 Tax=Solimonas marina TaxID=2714601 RepID=A0A969W657_9GAMM|nr:ribosome silencing factor [Solimonas marina]
MPRNTKAATRLDPLATLALNALEDLKGQDITVLDVQKLTTVTDTMIICTGTSNRHVKSLAQNVAEDAKHAGHQPLGLEGTDQGEWVLVDLGGVVVHVMQAQARAFYQLEKLWTVVEEVEEIVPEAKPRKKPAAKKAAKKAPAKKPAAKKVAKTAKKPASKSAVKKAPAKAARKPAAKKAAPRKSAKR